MYYMTKVYHLPCFLIPEDGDSGVDEFHSALCIFPALLCSALFAPILLGTEHESLPERHSQKYQSCTGSD